MNTVLLITVTLALTLVHAMNNQPCQRNPDNNAYNKFVNKHILQETFNRRSKAKWKRYIQNKGLCRRPTQSFLDSSDQFHVEQICNGMGSRLSNNNNLCISDSTMLVYDLKVDRRSCEVTRLSDNQKPVIVACDEVENRCLPVHFEKYNNEPPNPNGIRCQP